METREPGQVRKEAALSGHLQAPRERRTGVGKGGRATGHGFEGGCTIRILPARPGGIQHTASRCTMRPGPVEQEATEWWGDTVVAVKRGDSAARGFFGWLVGSRLRSALSVSSWRWRRH